MLYGRWGDCHLRITPISQVIDDMIAATASDGGTRTIRGITTLYLGTRQSPPGTSGTRHPKRELSSRLSQLSPTFLSVIASVPKLLGCENLQRYSQTPFRNGLQASEAGLPTP